MTTWARWLGGSVSMVHRDLDVDAWFGTCDYPGLPSMVSLLFHSGAALPDPTGLLEGCRGDVPGARFLGGPDLRGLVAAWIELKG